MINKTISLTNFNYSLIKDNCFLSAYIYSNINYIILKCKYNNKYPNMHTYGSNSLVLETKDIFVKKDFEKKSRQFLKQFLLYHTYKIKFAGKGYKIKKPTKKSFFFLFNKSHPCVIWWKNIHFKKFKKYKTYIKSTNPIRKLINTILKIRVVNVFTKKGLKLTKNILYKKKGKK